MHAYLQMLPETGFWKSSF